MSKLYEHLYSKYSAGCYCVGDVVKFVGEIKKSPDFKSLQPDIKEKLDDMIDADEKGDAVIVVAGVTSGVWDKPEELAKISIAYSQGGGRWFDPISIPATLGEFIKVQDKGYANIPNDIPPNAHRNQQALSRREEVNIEEIEKHRDEPNVSTPWIPEEKESKKKK